MHGATIKKKLVFEELLRVNPTYKLLESSLLLSRSGADIFVVSPGAYTKANYFNTIYRTG